MAAPNGPPPSFPGYTPRPQVRFDAIGEAWRLVQQQLGTWILATLVFGVIMGGVIAACVALMMPSLLLAGNASSRLGGAGLAGFGGAAILGIMLMSAIGALLTGGLYRMATRQIRGEPIAVGDMFSVTDVFGPLIIVAIVVGIAENIGYRLCILPGLLLSALWILAIPLVVDQRLDAFAAMRASWQAIKNDLGPALLFLLVLMVIMFVSAIPCGLGLFVSLPLYVVSISIVYRDFFLSTAPPPPPAPPASGPMAPPPVG